MLRRKGSKASGLWSGRPSAGLRACRWTIAAPACAAPSALSAISSARDWQVRRHRRRMDRAGDGATDDDFPLGHVVSSGSSFRILRRPPPIACPAVRDGSGGAIAISAPARSLWSSPRRSADPYSVTTMSVSMRPSETGPEPSPGAAIRLILPPPACAASATIRKPPDARAPRAKSDAPPGPETRPDGPISA